MFPRFPDLGISRTLITELPAPLHPAQEACPAITQFRKRLHDSIRTAKGNKSQDWIAGYCIAAAQAGFRSSSQSGIGGPGCLGGGGGGGGSGHGWILGFRSSSQSGIGGPGCSEGEEAGAEIVNECILNSRTLSRSCCPKGARKGGRAIAKGGEAARIALCFSERIVGGADSGATTMKKLPCLAAAGCGISLLSVGAHLVATGLLVAAAFLAVGQPQLQSSQQQPEPVVAVVADA